MPNDDFAILCPYYHKVMGNMIFCETLICDGEIPVEESFIKQKFCDRKSRNFRMKKFCSSFNYSECRIAALNDILYESKK